MIVAYQNAGFAGEENLPGSSVGVVRAGAGGNKGCGGAGEKEHHEMFSHNVHYDQVCPVILRLTDADSVDDYRTEAVALLSKMAPLIGKENSEEIFLDR